MPSNTLVMLKRRPRKLERDFTAVYDHPVTPEAARLLLVPSRNRYHVAGGNRIPDPASPEELAKDVAAWLSPDPIALPAYILGSEHSVSPHVDVVKAYNGRHVTPGAYPEYLTELRACLSNDATAYGRRVFIQHLSDRDLLMFLSHPLSPQACLSLAIKLSLTRERDEVVAYLWKRSVTTPVEEILQLPVLDLFFFLTRFYGRPPENLYRRVSYLRLFSLATTDHGRLLVSALENEEQLPETIEEFITALDTNPEDPQIFLSVGAMSRRAFLTEPMTYFKLLSRPSTIPVLDFVFLSEFRFLDRLDELLYNYTDLELLRLVSAEPMGSRRDLIAYVSKHLSEENLVLLCSRESTLFKNEESVTTLDSFSEIEEFFIGRGTLATGYDCFTLCDLITSWDVDGRMGLFDPVDINRLWTSKEIEALTNLLTNNRFGIDLPVEMMGLLRSYKRKSEIYADADAATLLRLRDWAKGNRETTRELWTTVFELGMYMRQWGGPGTPYPIKAEDTTRISRSVELSSDPTTAMIPIMITRMKERLDTVVALLPEEVKRAFHGVTAERFVGEAPAKTDYTMERLYELTLVTSKFCIRMVSEIWIYTGALFLNLTLDETIEGFDLESRIDHIQ